MTPTPDPIKTILDQIFAYGIDWTEFKDKSENDHEVSTYAGKIKDELKAQLTQAINNELLRARIYGMTELYEWVQSEGRIHSEIKKHYQERIAQLKQSQTEGGE